MNKYYFYITAGIHSVNDGYLSWYISMEETAFWNYIVLYQFLLWTINKSIFYSLDLHFKIF